MSALRSGVKWLIRQFQSEGGKYPDIVSLHDARTGHQHLEDTVPVREGRRLSSGTSRATPEKITHHLSSKQAYLLTDVHVWLDEGVITTPDGALIAETLPSHYRFVKMLQAGAYEKNLRLSRSVDTIDRCTCLGGGKYFGNYYHWWIDEIPRLQALWETDFWPDVATVPSAYPERLIDLIQKLVPEGVETRQASHRNEWVHAHEFLFLPPVTDDYCGHLPSSFVHNLRQNVVRTPPPDRAQNLARRYYVSRAGSSKRRVLNEQEVFHCLEQYGFEAIRPETFSVKEQVRRFRNAEWIVGAHGAGLTNMIFSPDCTIVELFPGAPFTHYRWLSESLGHDYYNVVGDPEAGKHDDFEVDISALQRILDESVSKDGCSGW